MIETIITILGSSSITGAITWLVSRRKRNNDFLSELQNSIELLSKNYTETLNELVIVKRQNAELLTEVSQLREEVSMLKQENAQLINKINELKKLIKQSPGKE